MAKAVPESFALNLHEWDDQEEQRHDNGSFDAEGLQCAVLGSPRNLEESDGKAAQGSREIDECRNFTLVSWETIVTIRVDSDGIDHDCNFGKTPAHDDCAYRQLLLECAAQREETSEIQRHRNVARPETDFGLEDTLIPSDTPIHDPIVRVTTDDLADDDCNDGCTVNACNSELTEPITNWGRGAEEDGVRHVDTDAEAEDHRLEEENSKQVRPPNDSQRRENRVGP